MDAHFENLNVPRMYIEKKSPEILPLRFNCCIILANFHVFMYT